MKSLAIVSGESLQLLVVNTFGNFSFRQQASQTFFGDSFMILCSFFGIFYAILCQFQQNFMPFYAHFTENFMLSNECFPSLNIRSSMKYQIPFRFLPSFPLFLWGILLGSNKPSHWKIIVAPDSKIEIPGLSRTFHDIFW